MTFLNMFHEICCFKCSLLMMFITWLCLAFNFYFYLILQQNSKWEQRLPLKHYNLKGTASASSGGKTSLYTWNRETIERRDENTEDFQEEEGRADVGLIFWRDARSRHTWFTILQKMQYLEILPRLRRSYPHLKLLPDLTPESLSDEDFRRIRSQRWHTAHTNTQETGNNRGFHC